MKYITATTFHIFSYKEWIIAAELAVFKSLQLVLQFLLPKACATSNLYIAYMQEEPREVSLKLDHALHIQVS